MAWDAVWDRAAKCGTYAFERASPFGDSLVDVRVFADAVFTRSRGTPATPAFMRAGDDEYKPDGAEWKWVEHGESGGVPVLEYRQGSPILFESLYDGLDGFEGAMVRFAGEPEHEPEECDTVEVVLPSAGASRLAPGGLGALFGGLSDGSLVVARVSVGRASRLVHSEDVLIRSDGAGIRIRGRAYAFGAPVVVRRPDAVAETLPALPRIEGRVSHRERLVVQVVDLRSSTMYAHDVPIAGGDMSAPRVAAGDMFEIRFEGDVVCLKGDTSSIYVDSAALPGAEEGRSCVADSVRTLDITDLTLCLADGGEIISGQYTADVTRVAEELRAPLVIVREWSGEGQIVAAIETADGRRIL
jgi:hypothetical protein